MLNKKIGLAVLLAGFAASDVMAQNTIANYSSGDVLLCFRKPGANDLVVDIGSITTLSNLTANQRYVIPGYTGTQLSQVGTNSVDWSAFGYNTDDTLFMTRARTSLNTEANAWIEDSGQAQQQVATRIATIPTGADSNFGGGLNNPDSTGTAIIEEDNSIDNPNYQAGGLSYRDALIGSYGSPTFDGYFQGNPENGTQSHFTTNGIVQRSDFYQLNPGSYTPGKWLGYFELNTNGVMTYVAYPSSPAKFKSVSRTNSTTYISYVSGLYGSYTLRETNSAGLAAPILTWPAVTVLTSGDTAAHNVTDTTTDTNRFYIISAQ